MRIPTLRACALAASLAVGAALIAPSPALSQEGEVTIVMNLQLVEGTAMRRALTSVRPILEHIRAQPGLISETLLMGSVDVSQDYVHVTRWESVEDWEALHEDQAFLDLLSAMNPGFEPAIAQVYMGVPPAAQP